MVQSPRTGSLEPVYNLFFMWPERSIFNEEFQRILPQTERWAEVDVMLADNPARITELIRFNSVPFLIDAVIHRVTARKVDKVVLGSSLREKFPDPTKVFYIGMVLVLSYTSSSSH